MVAFQLAKPVSAVQCSARLSVGRTSVPRRVLAAAVRDTRKSLLVARAAEAEAAEVEEEEVEEASTSSWAVEELRALEENVEHADPPVYSLSFLWLDKNVAVAADQVFGSQRAPMTEYFFWPKKDAWEELKASLETRPWISERDRVLMLNQTTEVINYWQDDTKHSLEEARGKFPECKFLGS